MLHNIWQDGWTVEKAWSTNVDDMPMGINVDAITNRRIGDPIENMASAPWSYIHITTTDFLCIIIYMHIRTYIVSHNYWVITARRWGKTFIAAVYTGIESDTDRGIKIAINWMWMRFFYFTTVTGEPHTPSPPPPRQLYCNKYSLITCRRFYVTIGNRKSPKPQEATNTSTKLSPFYIISTLKMYFHNIKRVPFNHWTFRGRWKRLNAHWR